MSAHDASSQSFAEKLRKLSPPKRAALLAAGIVFVVGVVLAVWIATSPAHGQTTGDAATGQPTPSGSAANETASPQPTAADDSASAGSPAQADGESAINPDDVRPQLNVSRTPLITGPLPNSASGDGTLVDGFPAEIMGLLDGAEIVSNEITVEGSVMEVALVARANTSPADISTFYADRWAALGLSPQRGGDDGSLSSSGAFEWITLSFAPTSDSGSEFMLYGLFRTS